MLVLFDIDRTLLETDAAGVACLLDAGRSLFGPSFTVDGVPFGGRLDPLIIRDMLANSGVEPSAAHAAAMRRAYHERMARAMARPGAARALAGAADLVDAVEAIEHATIGLLTGNFEQTGRLKLAAAGFDADRFPVRVWGDECPCHPPAREHLPPVGVDRFTVLRGRAPERVVIIGDTVHDVSCGLAHGCLVIGVATGHDAAADLAGAGAHLVVDDLTDTRGITAWLTSTHGPLEPSTPPGPRATA